MHRDGAQGQERLAKLNSKYKGKFKKGSGKGGALRTGGKFRGKGREGTPPRGNVLIALTHRTYLPRMFLFVVFVVAKFDVDTFGCQFSKQQFFFNRRRVHFLFVHVLNVEVDMCSQDPAARGSRYKKASVCFTA